MSNIPAPDEIVQGSPLLCLWQQRCTSHLLSALMWLSSPIWNLHVHLRAGIFRPKSPPSVLDCSRSTGNVPMSDQGGLCMALSFFSLFPTPLSSMRSMVWCPWLVHAVSVSTSSVFPILWDGSKGVINFPWIFRQCGAQSLEETCGCFCDSRWRFFVFFSFFLGVGGGGFVWKKMFVLSPFGWWKINTSLNNRINFNG